MHNIFGERERKKAESVQICIFSTRMVLIKLKFFVVNFGDSKNIYFKINSTVKNVCYSTIVAKRSNNELIKSLAKIEIGLGNKRAGRHHSKCIDIRTQC